MEHLQCDLGEPSSGLAVFVVAFTAAVDTAAAVVVVVAAVVVVGGVAADAVIIMLRSLPAAAIDDGVDPVIAEGLVVRGCVESAHHYVRCC